MNIMGRSLHLSSQKAGENIRKSSLLSTTQLRTGRIFSSVTRYIGYLSCKGKDGVQI